MKKILFVLVAVAVVTGTSFFVWQKQAGDVQSKPRGVVTATITYTDGGYVPNEVTIKKSDAVRWVNESSVEMWPAAAVHPTHSLYPEKSDSDCLGSSFDACKRIPSGGLWEFTFNDVGSWKFHDHVRPSKTGVVTVD